MYPGRLEALPCSFRDSAGKHRRMLPQATGGARKMFSSSETTSQKAPSDFCPRRGDGVELRRWSLCKEIRASDNSPFDFRWVFDDVDANKTENGCNNLAERLKRRKINSWAKH